MKWGALIRWHPQHLLSHENGEGDYSKMHDS